METTGSLKHSKTMRFDSVSRLFVMRVITLGTVLVLGLLAAAAQAQKCGEKKVVVQQLIFSGYKALSGAWPWHGAMFHRLKGGQTSYACGVTILTERFVITAVHCTIDQQERQRMPAERVYVKVGLTDLDSPERYVQQHNVANIIRHEEYDGEVFENDIALMKLNTEITYSEYVQPICLWQGDTNLRNVVSQTGYIVGWGYNEDYGLPKDLNEATMPIVSRKECIDSDPNYYRKVYFEQKTFCAGYRNGTIAAPGDSGGGLFLRQGNSWVIRGIISNTKSDPNTLKIDAKSFVVLTDVTYYLDWIKVHVTSVQVNPEPIELPPPSQPASRSLSNLLDISDCGKDSYKAGTVEESKGFLNQYPWLAVVEFVDLTTRNLEDVCHGVLVHPSFLVTAAHCVQRKRTSTLRSVRLNDYRLDTITDIFELNGKSIRTTAERIAVKGMSVHPNYNNPKYANNIALIKLERPTTATPICLPPRGSSVPTDLKFTIIGWKRNSRSEKPMIRNVVELADFNSCKQRYAQSGIDLDTSGGQVCSKYSHDDDISSCSHYYGSAPFQYSRMVGGSESRYFLAAISNFGHNNCKRDEYSDVFTNVGYYGDWIREKIRGNSRK